jgi:hypothetical protein
MPIFSKHCSVGSVSCFFLSSLSAAVVTATAATAVSQTIYTYFTAVPAAVTAAVRIGGRKVEETNPYIFLFVEYHLSPQMDPLGGSRPPGGGVRF